MAKDGGINFSKTGGGLGNSCPLPPKKSALARNPPQVFSTAGPVVGMYLLLTARKLEESILQSDDVRVGGVAACSIARRLLDDGKYEHYSCILHLIPHHNIHPPVYRDSHHRCRQTTFTYESLSQT